MTSAANNLAQENRHRREPHVLCPGCDGTGNGRGIEAGLGCGYCHGYGTIAADYAAFLQKHPRFRTEARS